MPSGLTRLLGAAAVIRPEVYQMTAVALPLMAAVETYQELTQDVWVEELDITAQEFAQTSPDHLDILARMENLCRIPVQRQQAKPKEIPLTTKDEGTRLASLTSELLSSHIDVLPVSEKMPELLISGEDSLRNSQPPRPLSIELLPQVFAKRKQLETLYHRKKPPYDLVKAAKYLIWAEHGDEVMQLEAIDWLELNDSLG